MTESQKNFCDEYLIDFNATRAYKTAFARCNKDETASVNGSKLLRNTKVQKYLTEKIQENQKRIKVRQDEILQELKNIAFSNGTDFAKIEEKEYEEKMYDRDGKEIGTKTKKYQILKLMPTDELTAEQKSAIASIKETRSGIEIKTADKVKALELLGKHIGLFNDKVEVTQGKPFEVNISIRKKVIRK